MRDLAANHSTCAINTATLGFQAPIGLVIDAVASAGFGGIGSSACDWASCSTERHPSAASGASTPTTAFRHRARPIPGPNH